MLTGESQFHISIPLGIEPGSLMMGSTRVDHWTSGTVYECIEIAGFHSLNYKLCYFTHEKLAAENYQDLATL